MSANNTPRNIGGQRVKGELNEQGVRSRINTINRVKEAWGVSELMDIFPREIRPADQLGSTTITNLRAISNLCPELKKARTLMLKISRNPDGSYKPFSFSQSKALMEQLKEAKNMLSAGDNQSAKKKGATPGAATPNTTATFDSPAPPSSPLKGKQAKKDKAQAAGQELLASIEKATVESAAEDDGESSIVVDTALRQKSNKKVRASLDQAKHGQTPAPKMAATAPVAVMSTEGSQSPIKVTTAPVAVMSTEGSQNPTKVTAAPVAVMFTEGSQNPTKMTTAPVAVMSTKGSQAPGPKAKPRKKSGVNVGGHDSDSEDSGSEDTGINTGILDLVNGNAPAKAVDNGFGKPTEKPTKARFATTETIGRMVVPSRELVHPFSNKNKKRLEQSETSNPPTVDKPAMIRKPFTNLMTTATVPKKPKTFEPPKQRIQKAGNMKKELGMDIQANSGIQGVDSNMGIKNVDSTKKPQHDTVIYPADVNNAVTNMEDVQQTQQVQQVQNVEATDPITTTIRTHLPTSPKKRTASTMLRAADEPNPQVERSVRARIEQRTSLYNSEKVLTDLLQYERVLVSFTEAHVEAVTASLVARDAKSEEAKMEFGKLLTEVKAVVGSLRGRLMEIAEREE
ncbi:hypothetical protein VE02_01803 [Pseudogymnoascus sp. 03VT05]|nr:hypothetical protein VE02_01803 [Pseudogymnoascus sp. 03VT05]